MRAAIVATIILLCAGGSSAQSGGHISLYSDNPGFSDCLLVESLYVVNSIWIVHTLVPEASGVSFRVVHNWHGPIVGSVSYHGNTAVGDVYTGVTVTNPGCMPLPHLVAQLDFIPTAATPPCTAYFFIVPDGPVVQGQIEVDLCGDTQFATGGGIVVNGNAVDCPCEYFPLPWPDWVATELTTWGSIKAMYR